jgi:hypothetical protein
MLSVAFVSDGWFETIRSNEQGDVDRVYVRAGGVFAIAGGSASVPC